MKSVRLIMDENFAEAGNVSVELSNGPVRIPIAFGEGDGARGVEVSIRHVPSHCGKRTFCFSAEKNGTQHEMKRAFLSFRQDPASGPVTVGQRLGRRARARQRSFQIPRFKRLKLI